MGARTCVCIYTFLDSIRVNHFSPSRRSYARIHTHTHIYIAYMQRRASWLCSTHALNMGRPVVGRLYKIISGETWY